MVASLDTGDWLDSCWAPGLAEIGGRSMAPGNGMRAQRIVCHSRVYGELDRLFRLDWVLASLLCRCLLDRSDVITWFGDAHDIWFSRACAMLDAVLSRGWHQVVSAYHVAANGQALLCTTDASMLF